MKGLLLKDLYMLRRYGRIYLLIFAIYILVGVSGDIYLFNDTSGSNSSFFFLYYLGIIAGMIPYTLLAYDEKEKWDSCSAFFPYNRADMVSAKYVMGLLLNVLLAVLLLIAYYVRGLLVGTSLFPDVFPTVEMIVTLGLVCPALTLPIIFRFGAEKGRIIYIAFMVLIVAVSFTSINMNALDKMGRVTMLPEKITLLPVIGIALLLYGISWLIAILLYRKKEL